MPPAPAPAASRVQITIDGTHTLVQRFAGGHATAEVLSLREGTERLPRKSISTVRFEPMVWQLGVSMGQPMLDWANSFIQNSHERKEGVIAFANANLEATGYLDFRDALITEFGMPGLDGSSKEAAFFTMTVRPQETTRRKGDRVKLQGDVKKQKLLRSNFRVTVGSLPTTRVKAVDAMSFTMRVQERRDQRFAQIIPTIVELPDLMMTIAGADLAPWEDWFTDFVINGNNDSAAEVSGAIEYLAPNGKDVLATLELSQIGIFELAFGEYPGAKDAAAAFTVSLYFEGATLKMA
jgi:hypothetical protein